MKSSVLLSVLLFSFALLESRSMAIGEFLDLGPLLGHISSTNARIWAKASGPARLSIRLGANEDLSDGREVKGPALEKAADFAGQILVSNLVPSRRYFYSVLLDGKAAMVRPYPSFVSAPPEGARGHVRFVFASCVGNSAWDSAGTWGDMATRTNFDLLLMLGDNHYANSTDPAVLGKFFRAQRTIAGYQEICRRVPQYAIWDNHDYSPEPCDKTAPDKGRALQTFEAFWPNPAHGEPDNPGVYFNFSRSGVEFFMTDDRYDRSPNDAPEDGRKSYLGSGQLSWLKRGLLASRAAVKIIASGGEFQTFGMKNSWTSFKRERDELFKFIEDHEITGVILISGDRHFTAAYQVTGKFIEVTSGPLGSANAESKPLPEMFYYGGRGKFYCIFDIDTARVEPAVTLEVYRTGDGLVRRREFAWGEILGTTRISPLPVPDGNTRK